MCPVCIANAMLAAAGATSTGGLAAFAMKQFFFNPTEIIKQTKQNKMKTETMEPNTKAKETNPSRVVSEAEWLVARKDLLTREKELTRLRDEVSCHRRELPWVKVKKEYVFDGPNGKETLSDLFENRSQLIVYHFMFAPGWEEGCKSCSYLADHFDGANWHLPHRDVTFVVISRAPLSELEAYKKAHGLAVQMVVVVRQRFQFRLSRLGHRGGKSEGEDVLQL